MSAKSKNRRAEREIEKAQEERRAPKGKFRVMEIDKFHPIPHPQVVIKDFDDRHDALLLARASTTINMRGTNDYDMACVYYVYDDQGNYIGGDVWVGE